MAYRPPVFNLFAAVYSVTNLGVYTLRGYCPCQLRGPTNSMANNMYPAGDYTPILWEALFPKGIDIRDRFTAGTGFIEDAVEITPGTVRFYNVVYFDDKAAGFSNEYRMALLEKNWGTAGPWPWATVDPTYTPPPMGPWVPPYTGP